MKHTLIFILLTLSSALSGQFGVRAKYNSNDFGNLSRIAPAGNAILDNSLEVGVDYWFRLKSARIEFSPEISYEITKSEETSFPELGLISHHSFNLNFNTMLYILDFQGDCDCPTFSKTGNTFTKGFHLILSPGLRLDNYDASINALAESKLGWSAGIGAGWDIGINDLITLTPFGIWRISPSQKWNKAREILPDSFPEDFNLSQVQIGLRVGFRPDYVAPRF